MRGILTSLFTYTALTDKTISRDLFTSQKESSITEHEITYFFLFDF